MKLHISADGVVTSSVKRQELGGSLLKTTSGLYSKPPMGSNTETDEYYTGVEKEDSLKNKSDKEDKTVNKDKSDKENDTKPKKNKKESVEDDEESDTGAEGEEDDDDLIFG